MLLRLLPPCLLISVVWSRPVEVAGDEALREALSKLKAGDTLRIAPGSYRAGLSASHLQGNASAPIVVEGADPARPPRFEGGSTGLHLTDCAHLTLRNLHFQGQQLNGLNIDDGGSYESPAHHLTLDRLHFSDIGSGGNHDAVKLSGVDDFAVRHCTVEGWDGQAIDMVGCHRGSIEHCLFRGKEGRRLTSGPQTKGGSADIVIRHCRFENAGGRPLQLGGATGAPHFRPAGATYEARRIIAHDNLIVGGMCAVVFPSLDGGEFHHNTIVTPEKWVLRILQEGDAPGIAPSRNVDFHHNLIVFASATVRVAANVGGGTEPASFKFHDNLWFATDAPARSKPDLPARETDSRYDLDPKLDPGTRLPANPAAREYGWRPASPPADQR